MDKLNQSEAITFQYLTDEPPMPINVVFLGIDLGSSDETVYYKTDGKTFTRITKEEYEILNS